MLMKYLPSVLVVTAALFGCSPTSDTRAGDSEEGTLSQATVRDLHEEVQAGRVSLVSATGNGNSSGASVEGTLLNNTGQEIHLYTRLRTPLYLSNSGASQNMIAAQVFLRGGRYSSDGARSFITLGPRERAPVTFDAYCVDFDRDNPSPSDRFTVGRVPVALTQVMARIADHLVTNTDDDITVAAQLAVWLAQGEAIETIRPRFDFEPADERLARSLTRPSARTVEAEEDERRAEGADAGAGQGQLGRLLGGAEAGDAMDQYSLGRLYADGNGVREDVVVAYMWYNLAAAQGNEGARDGKERIVRRMTRGQITEAQRLSREWIAAHPPGGN